MEWSAYLDRIESDEYRYNVPAVCADADDFAASIDDLLERVGGDLMGMADL